MQISTPELYQIGLNGMLDQQTAMAQTQQELATGKQIVVPADNPTGAAQVVGLNQSIAQTTQYQTNGDAATASLKQEDGALTSVVNLLQNANTLAIQAMNGTQNAQTRQGIAQQVQQDLQQLQSLANTRDSNGQYIFAGSLSGQQPFVDQGGGVVGYVGDQAQRFIQIGASRQVAVRDSGYSVFMNVPASAGGTQSIFKTLSDFVSSLQSNSPSASSITDIQNALQHVLQVQAAVGSRQNAVTSQQSLNSNVLLATQGNLSQIQDLNYASAISQYNQQLTALQAAQKSFATIQGLSLFNYIS